MLFATGTGGRLFAADVWRAMRRLAAQAGLPDDLTGHLGPEAMRHSFATLYLDAGGSLSDLQEVMGHADPRTTRRYDREREAPTRVTRRRGRCLPGRPVPPPPLGLCVQSVLSGQREVHSFPAITRADR